MDFNVESFDGSAWRYALALIAELAQRLDIPEGEWEEAVIDIDQEWTVDIGHDSFRWFRGDKK